MDSSSTPSCHPDSAGARLWFEDASSAGGEWRLGFDGFDPTREPIREVLCTLGNGYWAGRGAAPESGADDVHYPGTYLAGVYNRLSTLVQGEQIEDESLVNAPNWQALSFRIADGSWFRAADVHLLRYRQELDMRRGVLTRVMRVRDEAGRTTRITSRRLMSQAVPYLAALETIFEAEDWTGPVQVRAGLDGNVANRGVPEYRLLADRHLEPTQMRQLTPDTVLLGMVTTQSGVHIAMAARTRVQPAETRDHHRDLVLDRAFIGQDLTLDLAPGRSVSVEKVVAVSTSRDRAISTPELAAEARLKAASGFAELLTGHERAWTRLWDRFAIDLHTDTSQEGAARPLGQQPALALTLHIFHVLQTVSQSRSDLDSGVPARGLHGEGYRGHVFWDELFVYPMLTLRDPSWTRALLLYRYRRLDAARAAAREAGHEGAMFPWQSGSDGREETPVKLWNARAEEWMPDNSRRQRHVGLAIAYTAWQYYQITQDLPFLADYGTELLVEVARFFTSLARYDPDADRYDITGVMGPDEFHDGYPGGIGQGLRNNAYTNVLTAWVLARTIEAVELTAGYGCGQSTDRLNVRPGEVAKWDHLSRRLRVPFHPDGIISQFDGYLQLPELDWDAYRTRYEDLGRLDLILAAEGDNTDNYRVHKQADVLTLLYLLSAEELRDVLHRLGYRLAPDTIPEAVDFYLSRATHGSSLCRLVHSWVLARSDRHRSWELLSRVLQTDLTDRPESTTRTGVHLGAMAGSVDMILRCYTGLEARSDMLWLHPALPPEITRVRFEIVYRSQPITIDLTPQHLRLRLHPCAAAPIRVSVHGRTATLQAGQTCEIDLPATAKAAHP